MSRQADIIGSMIFHCKKNKIGKEETINFIIDVLQDAGQIEVDENGEPSQDDRNWLTTLVEKELT